jgi:hypothetical protein
VFDLFHVGLGKLFFRPAQDRNKPPNNVVSDIGRQLKRRRARRAARSPEGDGNVRENRRINGVLTLTNNQGTVFREIGNGNNQLLAQATTGTTWR